MRPLAQPDALYPNSCFHEGQFLGITEAVRALEQDCGTSDMVQNYNKSQWYFPKMQQLYQALPPKQFPVVRLRHVTIEDRFMGILQDGEISGSARTFLLKGAERSLRVSCWGVHIPPKKLEAYRKKRFAQFTQLATERGMYWNLNPEESAEVREMLANSPAMREDSRYGNFQFSFSTKDLLAMYRDQHCGGQKPVLRVLGTEAFKQELVHWILIHSPACVDFNHLPMVDPPGPFSRDGNLVWTPESMTNQFVYKISNSALCKIPMSNPNNRPMQNYDAWIWNNAVFAFYLPEDSALRIDRRNLLDSVQACETAQSQVAVARNNYLRHPLRCYRSKESAQATIEAMKRQREGIKRQRKAMKRQRNANRNGPQPPSWNHPHFY